MVLWIGASLAPYLRRSFIGFDEGVTASLVERFGLFTIIVLGEVVGVHIDAAVIVDGVVDIVKMQSLARCGYMDYTPGKRSDVPEQARLAVTRGAANRREAVSGCLQMYNRRRSNMTDTGSSH